MFKKLLLVGLLASPLQLFAQVGSGNANNIYDFINNDELAFKVDAALKKENVKSVTLYNQSFSGNTRSNAIQTEVHARLIEMLQSHNILIRECLECDKTFVTLTDDEFSIKKGIENNQMLRNVGLSIRSDSFLLWNVRKNGDGFDFSFKIVKASNNALVTNEHYAYAPQKTAEREKGKFAFTVGYQNIDGSNRKNNGYKDSFDDIMNASFRYYTPVENKIKYAVTAEIFTSTSNSTTAETDGTGFDGRGYYQILEFYENGNVSLYAGPGIYMANDELGLMGKAGFEVQYTSFAFFDLGVAYYQEQNFNHDKEKFGGAGVEFTMGLRF